MNFHILDPLQDRRWSDFAATHPRASVFHQVGWIRSLARTYGYRPLVITSAPPGQPLSDGIVFCEVNSWFTGRRLVSLPFSDHVQPLLQNDEMAAEMVRWASTNGTETKLKYIELRPAVWNPLATTLSDGASFWFHRLDLADSLETLFGRMHRDCFQRRIRHAEKSGLNYESGNSAEQIRTFYRLMVRTRRRHRLLPQPQAWFVNIAAEQSTGAMIHIARNGQTPVAAICTLFHGDTLVYKYGCSDERFHNLGGMPFLFWKAIEKGKAAGALQMDLGRTDLAHASLKQFKERLGGACSRIAYLRWNANRQQGSPSGLWCSVPKRVFSILPDGVSSQLGATLYRHFG